MNVHGHFLSRSVSKNTVTEAGEPSLKAGMLARAVLPTGVKQKVRMVPKRCARSGRPVDHDLDRG